MSVNPDQNQVVKAMLDSITQFKGQLDSMLLQITSNMDGLKKNAIDNGVQLRQDYTKGYADTKVKMSDAVTKMIEAYSKNFNDLKAQAQENYNSLSGEAKEKLQSNLAKMKETMSLALSSPGPQQKVFQDTLKTVEENSTKTLTTMATVYKEMMEALEKNFQEGLKTMQQEKGSNPIAAATTITNSEPKKPNPAPGPAPKSDGKK